VIHKINNLKKLLNM